MTKRVQHKRRETAYHGSKDRKTLFVKMQREHLKQDRFLRGDTGGFQDKYNPKTGNYDVDPTTFQGCGIACSVESIRRIQKKGLGRNAYDFNFYDHSRVARYLGISYDLASDFEHVFEAFSDSTDAGEFAVAFALALKPGSVPQYDMEHLQNIHGGHAKAEYLLGCLRKAKPVVEVR